MATELISQPQTRGTIATYVELVKIKAADMWEELAKFGLVGALSFVIDLGLMNLLLIWGFQDKQVTARIVAVVAATTFNYFGNKYYTYQKSAVTGSRGRELALFFFFNGVGLLMQLGTMWFFTYALGFTGILAANIATFIGLGLSMVFRFYGYRTFVFADVEQTEEVKEEELKLSVIG